jgi:CYTH domain-containing protein
MIGFKYPTEKSKQGFAEKKSQPKEIERKFLVRSLPENLEPYPHTDIEQGYLAISEDGAEVRIRRKGKEYFQTVKSGGRQDKI